MAEPAVPGDSSSPAAARVREGVPPGSLRFLAALFSGSPHRPLVEAIYAFEAELRRVVSHASHEAAHARLQWWRGELDRLTAGRPSHPLAEALLPLRARRGVDISALHEMLVAADLDLARMTYVSWQELDAYLYRSAGVAQTLIAGTLAGDRGLSTAEREFARRVGAAVRQTEMLADLEHDLAHGRLYAPLQSLEAAGLEPTTFATSVGTPAAQAFLTDWAARVAGELRSLPASLEDAAHRQSQRHGLVLAALHARWLDRRQTSTRVGPSPGHLGALSRLWTAWRTAVRYA